MKRGIKNIVCSLYGAMMLWVAVSMFVFASCTRDEERDISPEEDSEALISLSLLLPASARPETRGMTATDEEVVKTIDILVFKDNKWAYSAKNEGAITSNGNKKTFTVKLSVGTGYDLVVLANSSSMVSTTGYADKTKDEVLNSLTMSLSAKWNAATGANTAFPMSSDPNNSLLLNKTISEGMTISDIGLYRMVAQVRVTLGAKDGVEAKSTFDLKSVQVYNRNTDGLLKCVFNNSNYVLNAKSSRVEGPLVYDNANGKTEITLESNRGISCQGEIYIFEAANTASGLTHTTRPCLVIGGVYGSDATTSYYRVDYSTDGSTYIDILRNHRYTVNITSIRGRGYDTADQAYRLAPVNMTTEVIVWDDSNILEVATDGQYSLGVNRKAFTFNRYAVTGQTNDNKLVAVTNFPNAWTVNVMDANNNVATSGWLRVQREGGTAAYSITVPAGTTTQQNFYLQADENTTGSSRTATIQVTAGRNKQVITITQGSQAVSTLKLTDNNGEVTEMIWAHPYTMQRNLTVTWNPTDKALNITNSPVNGGGYVFNPSSPFGTTTTGAGTQTYNISPPSFTATEITANPYIERSSIITFTLNGDTPLSKSVLLRQINYNVNISQGRYLMNGQVQNARVLANFQWKAEFVSATADKPGTIIQTFDTQYGSYNTTTGDPLSFTCTDYMTTSNPNNPSTANITVKFYRLVYGNWVDTKNVVVPVYTTSN